MATSPQKQPGPCKLQIVGQMTPSSNIGSTVFSRACLCRLKCKFTDDGKLIPTPGTICLFRGNERNCPVFEEGEPTQLADVQKPTA